MTFKGYREEGRVIFIVKLTCKTHLYVLSSIRKKVVGVGGFINKREICSCF